ncbi:FmdB family zinc ribbon protein [Nonomuraea turcica]|uniref:hypothetical protein n=1 Tax=Nonomuraea sp. G32 TaxID=3067274 RepID=UPI00273BEC49|nr:hypothetical protein [Nonomuraea sp. G32]MDP4501040.1 hypothetical protein [Nonomuraea sp. G32]
MTTWRINPENLSLGPEEERSSTTFTDQEWRAQEWPECPVCGTTVSVSRISTPSADERIPRYIMGRWECPNGCDPRQH